MRKILYSPGYGGGWVSWHGHSAPKEEKIFLLEYKPFIVALEAGKEITEKLQEQFIKDWVEKFGNDDTPFMGGIHQLKVMSVPNDAQVRITEYAGAESVEVKDQIDDWL